MTFKEYLFKHWQKQVSSEADTFTAWIENMGHERLMDYADAYAN